jgi:hypothetical protein
MKAPHHDEKYMAKSGKCFYCDREGGVPYLMTAGGELHCSRCFENFSPSEFTAWLEDPRFMVERAATETTEESVRADALYLGIKQPLCCAVSSAVA